MENSIHTSRLARILFVTILVVGSIIIPLLRMDKTEAGQISDGEINNFCNIWVWGFYDFMYINNGANNITLTVPNPGVTQIDITFTNELWFCRDRPVRPHSPLASSWGLLSNNYSIVEEGSSFNRLVNPSSTSQTKWPDSAVKRTTSAGHKEMVVSTNTAKLDVSGWANGSTHRVCTQWGVTSYNSAPVYEPVEPHCINVIIQFAWQLNAASSAVSSSTPIPGDTITWTHTLKNNGPGSTSGNITSSIGTSANFANGWGASIDQSVVSSSIAPGADIRTFSNVSRTYTIQPSDAGKTLCQWVNYTPTNSWGGVNGTSTPACVYVSYDYDLSPHVSGPATVQPGDDITFTYNIDKSGTSISQAVSPSVKQYVISPGGSFAFGMVDNVSGCGSSVYGACPNSEWAVPSVVVALPTESVSSPSSSPMSTSSIAEGSLVCQILAISPAGYDSSTLTQTTNRWSEPHCVMIAREPYLKIFNGDAAAGAVYENLANLSNSCTGTPTGTIKTYANANNTGSGSQVAAFAAGAIEQFVSASGQSLSVPSGWPGTPKQLTFANNTGSTYGGNFTNYPCIPDYWAGATSIQSGNVSVNGANPGPASRTVSYIDGNAYITGNVAYNNAYTGTPWEVKYNTGNTQVPSYWLVVRGDIYINPSVSQLDGVYVALPRGDGTGGRIYTCALGYGTPTAAQITNDCNTQLQVNGAFIAQDVKFLRTIHTLSESQINETLSTTKAAEVFNFSPEVWMSTPIPFPQNQAGKYDSIVSMPPVL